MTRNTQKAAEKIRERIRASLRPKVTTTRTSNPLVSSRIEQRVLCSSTQNEEDSARTQGEKRFCPVRKRDLQSGEETTRGRRTTTTVREDTKRDKEEEERDDGVRGTSGEKKKFYPRRRPVREEKESLSEGADSGAGAGGGGETTSEMKEDEDKEDDSKHPDVAWTAVVTMLRHVDAFVKDSKEDPEIIASAYLWKEGRFFPILREALLASSSNDAFYCADTLAGEEKERAAMAVARKVEERWKRVKIIKRGREGERCERDPFGRVGDFRGGNGRGASSR